MFFYDGVRREEGDCGKLLRGQLWVACDDHDSDYSAGTFLQLYIGAKRGWCTIFARQRGCANRIGAKMFPADERVLRVDVPCRLSGLCERMWKASAAMSDRIGAGPRPLGVNRCYLLAGLKPGAYIIGGCA